MLPSDDGLITVWQVHRTALLHPVAMTSIIDLPAIGQRFIITIRITGAGASADFCAIVERVVTVCVP